MFGTLCFNESRFNSLESPPHPSPTLLHLSLLYLVFELFFLLSHFWENVLNDEMIDFQYFIELVFEFRIDFIAAFQVDLFYRAIVTHLLHDICPLESIFEDNFLAIS